METSLQSKHRTNPLVLLVEDEAQLRYVVGIALKRWQFDVIEAGDGSEALEAFQKHADSIMLALVDMGLPLINGYDVILELKNRRPDLPIILTSGVGEFEGAASLSQACAAGLLHKPFSLEQLRSVLQGAGFLK